MKFTIVGAGAMGSLFAYYLCRGGFEVILVDPWLEHIETIAAKGLTIIDLAGTEQKVFPAVKASFNGNDKPDCMLFSVKSYHTAAAASEAAKETGPGTVVLTLQNGLGNIELLAKHLPGLKVLAGSTTQGAHVLGPGVVRHAGRGETVIGKSGGGRDNTAAELVEIFKKCGLPAKESASIESVMWGKLLINAAINPLTALLQVQNGELLKSEQTLKMMELLVTEGEAVASAKGIILPDPDPYARAKAAAEATAANRSSMLQDFDQGRPTEIDFINGAIWKEGNALKIPAPCNELITLLVKKLEAKGSH